MGPLRRNRNSRKLVQSLFPFLPIQAQPGPHSLWWKRCLSWCAVPPHRPATPGLRSGRRTLLPAAPALQGGLIWAGPTGPLVAPPTLPAGWLPGPLPGRGHGHGRGSLLRTPLARAPGHLSHRAGGQSCSRTRGLPGARPHSRFWELRGRLRQPPSSRFPRTEAALLCSPSPSHSACLVPAATSNGRQLCTSFESNVLPWPEGGGQLGPH